jgi:hypothetical protein
MTMVWYAYWLARLQPHSLDSLVASLPRGSLGAQPFGGHTTPIKKNGGKKRKEGKEGINSHVGDERSPYRKQGVPGFLPVPVWGATV